MVVIASAQAMRLLVLLLELPIAWSDYYPLDLHNQYFPPPAKIEADCTPEAWSAPKLQPWDPLRALPQSVTVAWMPGWHPWCEVNHYHLEARQPGKFPLRFADLENLQHRELDVEEDHQDWPGDAEWTDWKLVYAGLSRAYTLEVDLSKGHAVQFRVQACGRRIKPGFDLTILSSASGRKYEVVREPYLGMLLHTDRDYTAADLGWFTARRGFVYVRTPMEDKAITSDTVAFTMNCPMACHVYLSYDYNPSAALHWWLAEEGWVLTSKVKWDLHNGDRDGNGIDIEMEPPYPRIEIWYKLFPAGHVRMRGNDDPEWAHGLPLIFVKAAGCPNPSAWSAVQTTHTVLGAAVDKINFYIRGMGKNSPDYTEIRVNHQTLYRRRDETGLVLAVFSRLDFSLKWLETYDTHRSRTASLQMSKDIRSFNETFFVFVASTIAWEWQATRTLALTMEYCGAYHFGQWVHIFAEQPHYESPKSDLQQTASQGEFGHPYVFIGIPGIGTGHGYESLMYNTGHYIPTPSVGTEKGFMRGIAYYDYVARMFRLTEMKIKKADFFVMNRPPLPETIHNPFPAKKTKTAISTTMLPKPYSPYVGTLQHHITSLIEANETVPPYNYAFLLYTVANVTKVDPRPRSWWVTEYERVWSGPSKRFWPHNGRKLHDGLLFEERNCTEYLKWGYAESSPERCGPTFACNEPKALNDFSSKAAMLKAGWKFTGINVGNGLGVVWNNALTFKPDKYRYDLTGQVPWTSYWGLHNPFAGKVSLSMMGKGTLAISFGNCWQYSLGYVELLVNGDRKNIAYSNEIAKSYSMDFNHNDLLEIIEFDAVMVINSVDIVCWGCCKTTDYPNVIATKCNVGVSPTLCRGLTKFQIQNLSHFKVIDTSPEQMSLGTR